MLNKRRRTLYISDDTWAKLTLLTEFSGTSRSNHLAVMTDTAVEQLYLSEKKKAERGVPNGEQLAKVRELIIGEIS